jgi:methyl-accepting chemotaxis protein
LFDSDGRRIAGNLEHLPLNLKTDNTVESAEVDRLDESGREKQAVRLIAGRLPTGDVLVIGRDVDEVEEIARVVGWALALGLLPAVLLCLAVGVALSARARRRIVEVNERVECIVAGNLRERLPHRNAGDPFSKLAMMVNGMLDEMETLIHSLAGIGNDIAHDLRTPLTRARLRLERGRTSATTLEQLQMVADKERGRDPASEAHRSRPASARATGRRSGSFAWRSRGRIVSSSHPVFSSRRSRATQR